jgi:hypothetical protein
MLFHVVHELLEQVAGDVILDCMAMRRGVEIFVLRTIWSLRCLAEDLWSPPVTLLNLAFTEGHTHARAPLIALPIGRRYQAPSLNGIDSRGILFLPNANRYLPFFR